MVQVVLQPSASAAAQDHYANTIARPVILADIETLLGAPLTQHLNQIFSTGAAPLWGVTPGANGANVDKWNSVEIGALVLFAAHGRVFGKGNVAAKFRNAKLARKLWGQDDETEQTWEYMYALDEVQDINIPYVDFNRALGYKPNFVIQGFRVLREDQSQAFLDAFDMQPGRIEWPPSPVDVERAVRDFDELERKFVAVQRLEQAALREHLLHGRPSGECLLCGRTFHAHFLVAAHIKKRSQCTDDEKRDLQNIGMLNCRFGCDELYERGYVGVDSDGRVQISPRLTSNVEQRYASEVLRSTIEVPSASKKYFSWHFAVQFER